MGAGCSCAPEVARPSTGWRRALWIALAVNAVMFVVELGASFTSGSVSLRADALDFLGDSANYVISLAVIGLALQWRSWAALLKGATLVGFGLWVFVSAVLAFSNGAAPEPRTMGVVGFCALVANFGVALLLYRFRDGDANMKSVWVCSRNDALGNIAVMFAAIGVFGTGSLWPDLVVAAVIATLALLGGAQIVRLAVRELRWRVV